MVNWTKLLLGKDKWDVPDFFHLALLVIFVALIAFITIKFHTLPA